MGRIKVDWHGTFAVMVSPFTQNGDIDEDAYRKVVDLVIEAVCHDFISAGSTGEFFLISNDERKRVFSIAVGAAGVVAMLPHAVGGMAVELFKAAVEGDLGRAQMLRLKIVRVYDLFKVGSGYIAIKESMNILGRPGGYSRLPMLPFTEEQRSQLRKIYEDVGLLVPSGV